MQLEIKWLNLDSSAICPTITIQIKKISVYHTIRKVISLCIFCLCFSPSPKYFEQTSNLFTLSKLFSFLRKKTSHFRFGTSPQGHFLAAAILMMCVFLFFFFSNRFTFSHVFWSCEGQEKTKKKSKLNNKKIKINKKIKK